MRRIAIIQLRAIGAVQFDRVGPWLLLHNLPEDLQCQVFLLLPTQEFHAREAPLLEVRDDVLDILLLARWRAVWVATIHVLEHATETIH